MKRIRTYKTEAEAEYEAGLLRAQGINCEVRSRLGKLSSGFAPSTLPPIPSLWVLDDADASRALEALDALPDPHGRPWSCPTCNSENEPQFDACWACGTDRLSSDNRPSPPRS